MPKQLSSQRLQAVPDSDFQRRLLPCQNDGGKSLFILNVFLLSQNLEIHIAKSSADDGHLGSLLPLVPVHGSFSDHQEISSI